MFIQTRPLNPRVQAWLDRVPGSSLIPDHLIKSDIKNGSFLIKEIDKHTYEICIINIKLDDFRYVDPKDIENISNIIKNRP